MTSVRVVWDSHRLASSESDSDAGWRGGVIPGGSCCRYRSSYGDCSEIGSSLAGEEEVPRPNYKSVFPIIIII